MQVDIMSATTYEEFLWPKTSSKLATLLILNRCFLFEVVN